MLITVIIFEYNNIEINIVHFEQFIRQTISYSVEKVLKNLTVIHSSNKINSNIEQIKI